MNIEKSEIVRLTEEYGGAWAVQHSRRLLNLIAAIGENLTYDSEALWIAAYIHDWGAYAPWAQKDVDHALRSTQVAETFLTEHGCPEDQKRLILECIEKHHGAGSEGSIESILLRDADALDFLGVIGIMRVFSKNPRELRKAYEETLRRKGSLLDRIYLEKARAIAGERISRMDALLAEFEAETSGCF